MTLPDQRQIELVQETFARVVPIADQAAGLFYGRLFETTPEVRPLFTGDMDEQGRKLMTTLGVVTRGLDDLGELLPVPGESAAADDHLAQASGARSRFEAGPDTGSVRLHAPAVGGPALRQRPRHEWFLNLPTGAVYRIDPL
jgi:hypothetical protein